MTGTYTDSWLFQTRRSPNAKEKSPCIIFNITNRKPISSLKWGPMPSLASFFPTTNHLRILFPTTYPNLGKIQPNNNSLIDEHKATIFTSIRIPRQHYTSGLNRKTLAKVVAPMLVDSVKEGTRFKGKWDHFPGFPKTHFGSKNINYFRKIVYQTA